MNFLDALVKCADASALFPGPIEFAGVGIPETEDIPEWIRFATVLARSDDSMLPVNAHELRSCSTG